MKVPGNESSRERKVPGRKVPGTWNFRSPGTKVHHRDLSFLGTKGLGYEKSVIRLKRHGEAYLKERSVMRNEDDVGGRTRVM